MKKNLFFLLFLVLASFANAQNQRSAANNAAEFTPFKSDEEKREWVKNHPQEYARLNGQIQSQVTTVPEFKNQAEKDAWLRIEEKKKKDEFLKTQSLNSNNRNVAISEAEQRAKVEASISNEVEKNTYLQKREQTIIMTEEEFNSLPANKKASVLADKNFIIQKNNK